MKTVSCLLCAFALAASHGADGKVQKPFAANARHQPLKTLGRDYWTILSSAPYTDPGYAVCGVKWGSGWNNASLTNLPVFRDCGVVRRASKPPPDSAGTASAWRTVREGCRDDVWKVIEADAKKDRPAVLVFGGKRHVDAMAGDIDLDHADWEAFKKARPNLIGTRTMCEWGNDLMLMMRRTGNIVNKARRAELESVWARHSFSNRYDRLALSRWYVDRKLKLHYGDMDTFMAFRGMYFLDHVAAAWGAKTLTAETTNTSGGNAEYRWDVSAMFIRGAARQFGVPWCWYAANFFNGPAKDGTWKNNSVSAYRYQRGNGRPEGGTSASAMRRCYYYAYLNGANAVEPESWIGQFFTTNTVSGLAELTGRGKDYSDFHDFTSAHPGRGATYAPVAILTPFAQGYTAYGGKSWSACPYTGGDYALDALFFTISPGWERAKGLAEGRQDGNFNNSRFAMMYDVLVPDSPQPKEDFAKALFSYPAAILVGDYPDPAKFADVLEAYERAGGKLVRIDPSELPPQRDISDIRAGRVKFPAVERKLEKLQRELFPFAVKGDCQYGANRTAKGWWLWVFNNKGVRKFADTFETIDRTKDAAIEVSFTHAAEAPVAELMSGRRIEVKGGRFTFTVPAGDFAIFEISAPSAVRCAENPIAKTKGNLLRNPGLESADGMVPDGWTASHGGAFVCTGGVLRISAGAPGYCHCVSQTVDIDGRKSHWFEADVKCDALKYYGNVRYSLLDGKGKALVPNRPLFHPHYKGPHAGWCRAGLPIPAQHIDRVRKLRLTIGVYNDSRKQDEDLALYIRNPSVSEYSGQEYRPLPPVTSRRGGKMPANPFPKLCPEKTCYRLEKGGVGFLSLTTPHIPRSKGYRLEVEAPEGVACELHLRSMGIVGKVYRRKETSRGRYDLPASVNWQVGANTLLFAADGAVPREFTIKLTISAGGEKRTVEVPVKTVDGPAPGKLPEKRRYFSWSERPLQEIDTKGSPLARALEEYWMKTGWERVRVANVTGVFPYRDDLKKPLARKGVGPHGTPTGIPCDSDLAAKGAAYYRDRLKAAKMEESLKNAQLVIWDYEPYVVGPVTTGCFCGDCRKAFARELGLPDAPSAETILESREREWVAFRCRQRAASVKVAVEGIKMLAPGARFGLCTMPMAPGAGDVEYSDDYGYFLRFGIDSLLYEDFTDSFCSMSYSPYLRYFRSLEREIASLSKPKNTLLENGWGSPRPGAIVALQLVAAYFAGLERPFIAAGLTVSDGEQLSQIRKAMQFVGETEKLWEGAVFRKDKYACTLVSGDANRLWSMDREAADGTRYVLVMNCSMFKPMSVSVKSPAGAVQKADLPVSSWRLLAFR